MLGPGDSDPDSSQESAIHVLEQALCHAALVIERLGFLLENLGLLSSGARRERLQASPDSRLEGIVQGFHRVAATPASMRSSLLDDPFASDLAESRQALLAALHAAPTAGLTRVVNAFELAGPALDPLVLALAPDWDLRIGALCSELNQNPRQPRPLVGHLIMAAQTGLPRPNVGVLADLERKFFQPGLLIRTGPPDSPVPEQSVRGADPVVALSRAVIAERKPGGPSWDELHGLDARTAWLRDALGRELGRERGRRLIVIEGSPGSGRLAVARASARDLGRAVECIDLGNTDRLDQPSLQAALWHSAYRAKITGSILVVRTAGDRKLTGVLMPLIVRWMTRLAMPCVVLIRPDELGALPEPVRVIRFQPPVLTLSDRRRVWSDACAAHDLATPDAMLDDAAARYDITPGRIWELAGELGARSSSGSGSIEIADIRATLRDITTGRMHRLATPCHSTLTLDDLVLADSVRTRLDDLIQRQRHRYRVLDEWQLVDRSKHSRGVSALLIGPAGTGKTSAAMAVANALDMDLFHVDVASILSKWVGETEQNLAKVFAEAEASSAALLFDESSRLFSTRGSPMSERHAELTVGYLLERMERYPGLVLVTTRDIATIDNAFLRRFSSVIAFPAATPAVRQTLWRRLLPPAVQYAADVDVTALSEIDGLEGAHIHNAITRAAFRAAAQGREPPFLIHRELIEAITDELDRARISRLRDPVISTAPSHSPPEPAHDDIMSIAAEHPYLVFLDDAKNSP